MIGGSVNHRSLLGAAELCPFHPNISLNDSHAVWNGHVCFTSAHQFGYIFHLLFFVSERALSVEGL